jgi:hypothetical protein
LALQRGPGRFGLGCEDFDFRELNVHGTIRHAASSGCPRPK